MALLTATLCQELIDMLTMPTKYSVLVDRAPVRLRKATNLPIQLNVDIEGTAGSEEGPSIR